MKAIIIIIITLFTNFVVAQHTLDTIYANDKKSVALFFPEPIRQGITGTSNFVFTYNREKEQYFGLLQATPGTESNLLTVTKNGQVYSYILKYKEQLSKLNYFITSKESIGSERPVILKQRPITEPFDRIDHLKKFSNHLLKSNYNPIATKRKKGVKLQLQEMVYNASEVYLVLEIKNKSEIDFEIDYLKVYGTNGNKKRKASYQRLEQNVLHQYKLPNQVKIGEKKRFVYVLPKFVLGDNEKLIIELKELKGSRKVILLD
ncbi:MAG: conjugative transposon protein TraN [Cytophagales bacterium]|nr:conjugative transposon protein TraN [Cytophagales bacterium]